MTPLRDAIDIMTGDPIDRDTRRARLLAARRTPIGASPGAASCPGIGIAVTSSVRLGTGGSFIAE